MASKEQSRKRHKVWYQKNKKNVIKKQLEKYHNNREKHRDYHVEHSWKRSGIVGIPENIHELRRGNCDICGIAAGDKCLAVDHDHRTGQYRGVLCFKCNIMLGKADDRIEILEMAIEYLGGE